jgi:chitin synthase
MAKFVMALIFSWFGSAKLSKDPITSAIANHYARANASKPLLYDDYEAKRLGPSPVRDGRQRGVAFLKTQPGANIPKPHPADLYTVLLVTCYSEGESSIRGTLDSLSATDYDDSKKLLFVIADGLVKGSENPVSTPEILISMMDHDPRFGTDPTPQSYVAVASGSKQHNMAQVYCGSYNYQGRAVPMVLVVKCGTEAEKSTAMPGNRGKRDSQLILMNFFSRVTMNDRMTPLDFDMFRKIHHITGVTPDFYEGVLMVDADTYVDSKCLRYLVNAVQNDHSIMGLCGETRIANKRQSWVTRIQVFEYFISHQMGKAFESIFGGVTCLPGCFSMWRIKTINTDGMVLPILGNPDILEQYSTNEVFTLHQKNLLLLGEDRFLTTIMLRQFPNRKTVFVPQAFCKTVVPDDFKTLLSQRRRWINSTIHNLMELVLVSNLCGTFCFSMQVFYFLRLVGHILLDIYSHFQGTIFD